MVVHGREVEFRRTVDANCKIDKITGGNWDEFFAKNEGYAAGQMFSARFIAALSEAAEDAKTYEVDGYIKRPLTVAEALTLDDETFAALFNEALDVWRGEKPTVKTKPLPSKKKAVKEAAASD